MKRFSPGTTILAITLGLSLVQGTLPLAAQSTVIEAPPLKPEPAAPKQKPMSDKTEKIILAGGCFWCTEAVFERAKGVLNVVSGYAGGSVKNPSYKAVSAGSTGHTEVIEVTFDPLATNLDAILDLFWHAHDPTTKDRQGNDHGTQYRSAIYYFSDEQKAVVEKSIAAAQKDYAKPITTEVRMAPDFYAAEDYHQDYFAKNPNDAYCNAVLTPKLSKLEDKKLISEERNSGLGK